MKIRILTTHYHSGIGSLTEGAVIDMEEGEARQKIAKSYAEEYVEPAKPVAVKVAKPDQSKP